MFRIALVQMLVEGGRPEANVQRAVTRIAAAADEGAQVIVLPEALTLGWTHPSARERSEAVPDGPACRALRRAALDHRVYVCAGLVERAAGRIYNAAVLFAPDGELLLHHRKVNELEIGHAHYDQGDRLSVVPTALADFGLMICADAFAPGQVIGRALGYLGASVILSPCAWAVPSDHDPVGDPYGRLWVDNYGPVARDFRLWIAGVSNVGPLSAGPWAGRSCIGCSLLIGPDGKVVARGPYGVSAETILYAEVNPAPRPTRGDGWAALWSREQSGGKSRTPSPHFSPG